MEVDMNNGLDYEKQAKSYKLLVDHYKQINDSLLCVINDKNNEIKILEQCRFNEKELVSFGNYLLKRFVNDADLQNWYILNRNNKQNKLEE